MRSLNILESILKISDPVARLYYTRQRRLELQEILFQPESTLSEDELQCIRADEIALGILEKVQRNDLEYLVHPAPVHVDTLNPESKNTLAS